MSFSRAGCISSSAATAATGDGVALTPVNIESFGGLRLAVDPEEAGWAAAIDTLNTEFDHPGRARSRDGYAKVTASAGATRYDSVYPVGGAASVASVTGSAGTLADDNSHGTVAWSLTAGALPATSGTITGGQITHYLKATNFGFAIPSTATIIGIVATFVRSQFTPSATTADESVRLVKAGSVTGADESAGALWGTGETKIFGGATDLWGTTWTPTQVNGSTFGIVIAAKGPGPFSNSGIVQALSITVYYQPTGSAFVAGAASARLDVIAVDGTVSATVATASDTQSSYVAFGSPTTSATYIANSGTTIRKLVGTTFSTPAGMPKAKFVAVQSPDNRLVAANINVIPTGSGATASTSLVHFSGADKADGNPETWGANNYIYLTPGDNEDIQGAISWREFVFIFKNTKFFAFYGNTVDASGKPVFNYRRITGAGMACPLGVCASPDGVYFIDRRGIYFTNGAQPARISSPVDPLFIGGASPFFLPGAINPSAFSQCSLAFYNGRLYAGLPLGTATANSHTLVFDPATGVWTLWDIPAGAMAASLTQPGVLLFTYASGTNDVGQYAPNAYTDDAGTAITSRYRSGFYDLGAPGREKTVRQTELVGQGVVSFGWSRDLGALTTTSTANVTLGTAPAFARTMHRLAQNGELLSYQIASVSGGAWQLDRVVPFIRPVREPGDKTQ